VLQILSSLYSETKFLFTSIIPEKYTNDVRTDLDVSSIQPSLLEDIPLSVSQSSSTQETQDASSDEPSQEEE
jgi:hypothetical protein